MSRTTLLLPASALVFNAFVWGVSWWPFRRLESAGLHPLYATALVYALAVVVITAARHRAWDRLARTPSLWLLVAASGITNAAFNWGVTIGDVVRVVLLFYLMPLWALLLARLLLHERLTPLALARAGLALTGAAIVLWPDGGGWPLPRDLADWLGVIGGFSFALNNVMLRRLRAEAEASRALAMFVGGMSVAGLAGVLLLPPGGGVPASWQAGWVFGTAALAVLFLAGNLALQYGAARLPANATAVIMLTEVVFASASAVALGGGRLTAEVAVGGALIVFAALLASLSPGPGRPAPA